MKKALLKILCTALVFGIMISKEEIYEKKTAIGEF